MAVELDEEAFVRLKQASWARYAASTPWRAQTPGRHDAVQISPAWGRFYRPLLIYRFVPILTAPNGRGNKGWTHTRWGFHKRADRDRFITFFKDLGARTA